MNVSAIPTRRGGRDFCLIYHPAIASKMGRKIKKASPGKRTPTGPQDTKELRSGQGRYGVAGTNRPLH